MSTASLLESLPSPYTVEPSSVLGQLVNVLSLQLETGAEDIGRVRLTHWVEQAYRMGDLASIAALAGVVPLDWETPGTFRARLIPLVAGRLRGSVSPSDVSTFVYEYLQRAEDQLGQAVDGLPAVLVPGLTRRKTPSDAFTEQPDRPGWRPLTLDENPARVRTSAALADRGGRVGHLGRWSDHNAGLDAAPASIMITGWPGGRTSVPLLVNLTSGTWIGFGGVVAVGHELAIVAGDDGSHAVATLDGRDVSDRLLGGDAYPPSNGLRPQDGPAIPIVGRGQNDWLYASAGLYDIPGVDRGYFSFAPPDMAEGAFDAGHFDKAIFPVGPAAHLVLAWTEHEPASFEVHVPRGVTVEPSGRPPLADAVGEALREAVGELRAAGVATAVILEPFTETQPHRVSVQLPWRSLPAEAGPTGIVTSFDVSGLFGETAFGGARFE